MKLNRAKSGPAPRSHIMRAIRHGVAEPALAARWYRLADEPHAWAICVLHQAASAVEIECAEANTSRVMPKPRSFE